MAFYNLVINPGSTSTKTAIFENEKLLFKETLRHKDEELSSFDSIASQKDFRKNVILSFVKKNGFDIEKLSSVVGRGGLLKPLKSGTYRVNEKMLKDLTEAKRGEHASNLGGLIAYEIASELNIPAFIVDPVSVDEYGKLAYYSGLKGLERESLSHALNTKAVAKRYAKERGKNYKDLKLIVAHLGSGISVSAHIEGKMIDVTNSMEEGAFSPERAGTVPCVKLAKLCFSGKYDLKDVITMLFKKGGIYSYLGTKDFSKVMDMVNSGNSEAKEVVDAMAYQIAKEIGAMATVLKGKVDAIIFTGGMAYDKYFTDLLKDRTSFISENIKIYPGEDELQALNEGALRVLNSEEEVMEYE